MEPEECKRDKMANDRNRDAGRQSDRREEAREDEVRYREFINELNRSSETGDGRMLRR